MFAIRELSHLNARSAALLAESEMNRQELLAECAKLQPIVESLGYGFGLFRRLRAGYLVAASLVGMWAARRGGSRRNLWSKLWLGWRLYRFLQGAWAGFKASRG